MEELVIGDKTYVSSKRASEITGYAKDYIGQLCREGRVQATLVGRSWYVLESSIREHRFGAEEKVGEPVEAAEAPVEAGIGLTWSAPVYKREPAISVEPVQEPLEEKETVLENMQTAWQDWFKSRGENSESVESEYGSEAQNSPVEVVTLNTVVDTVEEVEEPVEEQSTPVNISMIEEMKEAELVEVVEEPVAVYRTYSDPEAIETEEENTPFQAETPLRKGKSSSVVRSLLVVVAGVAVLVAFIGSGSFDFIAKKGNGIQAAAIYYLSGVREVK